MKTFTYRQSEIEPISPELKAQIADLKSQINKLTGENNGHYLALQELTKVLSNCLDGCDLNINCIEIVSDDYNPCSLKDLPIEIKQLIWSCSYTNSLLLKQLSCLRKITHKELVAEINKHSAIYARVPTVKEAEQFIDELTQASLSGDKNFFLKRMWPPSNTD